MTKVDHNHKDGKGQHIGFKKLEGQLAAKGATNPGGLARFIGEKKYGKAGFAALSKKK